MLSKISRNLLDKIEDVNASKFILNCRTCDYIEEAEKKDYKVETRDFTRQIRYQNFFFWIKILIKYLKFFL
jgi:hypothetical protein